MGQKTAAWSTFLQVEGVVLTTQSASRAETDRPSPCWQKEEEGMQPNAAATRSAAKHLGDAVFKRLVPFVNANLGYNACPAFVGRVGGNHKLLSCIGDG